MRQPFQRKDRGNKYYCEIGGKKHSLKTTNRQRAWSLFHQLEKEYNERVLYPDHSGRTLNQVIPEYLKIREQLAYNTLRADKLALKHLKSIIGKNTCINNITLKHLSSFTHHLLVEKNLSKTSVNIYIAHIKTFFSTLLEWKYIKEKPTNGWKKFRVEKKNIHILTEEERDIILLYSQQNELLKYIVPILLFTGTSRVEFTKPINITDKYISYNRTKTKQFVQIPIANKLKPYIKDLKPGIHVLWNRRIRGLNEAWSKFIKDTKNKVLQKGITIPNLTLKDIRSNVAVRLLEKTGDPELVADIIGHSDRGVTLLRNYTHVLNRKKKDVINLL